MAFFVIFYPFVDISKLKTNANAISKMIKQHGATKEKKFYYRRTYHGVNFSSAAFSNMPIFEK